MARGPASVSIEPDGLAASVLQAQGRLEAQRLAAVLGAPASVQVDGRTQWRAAARLTAGREPIQRVHIDSDTLGLSARLPAPLGKQQDERRDLQLELELGERTLTARGVYGEVRSIVRLRRAANGGWSFDRGGVRADGVAPSLPDHHGLRIEGSIERLKLDDWLALRSSDAPTGAGRPLSELLRAANVSVGEFELFGFRFSDLRGLLQATPAGWRVDVSSPEAAGQILIPENLLGEQPLRATLERLSLQKAPRSGASQRPPIDPRKLPALQVYVANLRYGARTLGAVDVKASRTSQGLRLDSASAIGEALRAQGRGRWYVTANGLQSALVMRVSSDDVASALDALDYTPFMEAKSGEVRVDLSWPGGWDEDLLEHASGAISVQADAGQLVNLQPGAGRMLGLFSVAALPRRLALDFSDLTDKGLAFDTIHGDFELRDGAAYTSNLLLRGPAAEIGIAGRTGLATRDYDQTAVVTGNLGASLPVAGALAGGPAVGAALLLFSQVFKEPLKGITRGYYRITGPWENPTVERIGAAEAEGSG